jgi:hypothetical protein
MQELYEDCGRLFPLEAPKSFDFANLSLYYEGLCSISFRRAFLGRTSVKFLSLVMLFVCVSGAFGQPNSSFYVSTTGDDSNPGTQTAPWRTVQHAADTVPAGSTVNVRGGVYEELVSIKASGDATDGYITFRSYPGETAILDAEHFTPSGRTQLLNPRKSNVSTDSRPEPFNLNPSRDAIFRELARVVRRGGMVFAAELILSRPLPPEARASETNWFA